MPGLGFLLSSNASCLSGCRKTNGPYGSVNVNVTSSTSARNYFAPAGSVAEVCFFFWNRFDDLEGPTHRSFQRPCFPSISNKGTEVPVSSHQATSLSTLKNMQSLSLRRNTHTEYQLA